MCETDLECVSPCSLFLKVERKDKQKPGQTVSVPTHISPAAQSSLDTGILFESINC